MIELEQKSSKSHKNGLGHTSKAVARDSDRVQTCNLLIRSQGLYSVELRSLIAGANIRVILIMPNYRLFFCLDFFDSASFVCMMSWKRIF